MLNPSLLPVFLREISGAHRFVREPEPELVMDDPEQVAAYSEAGRIDGAMAAMYLFHSARVSQVIQGCKTVLDLGCGPATQLAQIAQLNPQIQFTGVDLSTSMLADAEKHVQAQGLANVTFQQGDITQLTGVGDQSVDAVISTMALHHLPSVEHLDACFAETRRVLRPNGAVYLADFGRLKSEKSVRFFVQMNAAHQPSSFVLDTERSLRAAFLKGDFTTLASKSFGDSVRVHSTFKVPFLVLVKTADKPLSESTRGQLSAKRSALMPRYRRDLNNTCTFFTLGGLRNNPFA